MSESSRSRLGNISTDEGFAAATKLAYRAGLGHDEIKDIVVQLNGTKSGRQQETMVSHFETMYAERLKQTGGGVFVRGNSKKTATPRQRIFLALGQVLSLPDLSSLSGSIAAPERPDAVKKAREAATRLNDFADELERK